MCGKRDRCVMKSGGTVAEMGPVIKEQLDKIEPELMILQVGVNDVGPRRSVKLVNDFHALLQTLRDARKPAIVTGILPRVLASNEWYSRALAANSSVQQMCSKMGFHFVDLWYDFYGREEYYLGDGLHLSDLGARALVNAYRVETQGN